MPIYEYECKKCGNRFEMFRSISGSDDEVLCPACGEGKPKRVISITASSGGGGCGHDHAAGGGG